MNYIDKLTYEERIHEYVVRADSWEWRAKGLREDALNDLLINKYHLTEEDVDEIISKRGTNEEIKRESSEGTEFGLIGKIIAGSIGFAVAGPVGLAVAGGATCLYDNSVAKNNSKRVVKEVTVVAKKESKDKLIFAGMAKKYADEYKSLSSKLVEQSEYVAALEEDNSALRKEIERLHEQINKIYS